MFRLSHFLRVFPLLAIGLTAIPAVALAAPLTMDVYISPPGVVSTPIAGAITETFDSLATGNRIADYAGFMSGSPTPTSRGTYALSSTNPFNIQAANQYGGAGGTNYMALGSQSGSSVPVTLTLSTPQNYFGFWWSAGDAQNGISFYSGNDLLIRYSTVDVLGLLSASPPDTVTAGDGSVYNKIAYRGKPAGNGAGSGQNTGEPYAYISFVAVGFSFTSVVFDNNGTTGTGFESDNHSIYAGTITSIPSAILVSSNFVAVPEPSTLLLGGLALTGGICAAFRKLRRRRAG